MLFEKLFPAERSEGILERLFECLAIHIRDGSGERDRFRTHAHAILRIAAARNAVIIHDGIQANIGMHSSCRVSIEQAHLRKRRRPHEIMWRIGELRVGARLEATAACHAFGKLIGPFGAVFTAAGDSFLQSHLRKAL